MITIGHEISKVFYSCYLISEICAGIGHARLVLYPAETGLGSFIRHRELVGIYEAGVLQISFIVEDKEVNIMDIRFFRIFRLGSIIYTGIESDGEIRFVRDDAFYSATCHGQ